MSPSSPSNADAPGGADYKVATRALTADLSAARADESAREIGTVDAAGLRSLLAKLSALDSTEVTDADPQVVVTARRGRFTVRPGQGRLFVRSATDGGQHYWEMSAAEAPDFFDGRDLPEAPPVAVVDSVAVARPAETRLALGLLLVGVGLLLVAVSAWLTFRPDDWDPESRYLPVTAPAEAATARQAAAGSYVSGSGDDERILELDPNGVVRYREYGPGRELAAEHGGAGTLARQRSDQALVLRVSGLGTVELKNPNTVVFARDTYVRRGPAGVTPP